MKHQNISGNRPSRSGSFSHGLTRDQEMKAAFQTAFENGSGKNHFSQTVATFIFGGGPEFQNSSDAPSASLNPHPIGRIHLSPAYRPPAHLAPQEVDHLGYIQSLVSSASSTDVLDEIGRNLLGCFPDRHASDLDWMRTKHRALHRLLLTGHVSGALGRIRTATAIPEADRVALGTIVGRHVKCYIVRTARGWADDLALMATQPRGSAFAGFTTYKTVGHIMLASIVAPAKLLQRLVAAAEAGAFDGLSDAEVPDKLVHLQLLAREDVAKVMDIASAVRSSLGFHEAHGSTLFREALAYIRANSASVARLTQRDMREAGFGRLDMNEFRHGLRTSELITYLALELRRALLHVDYCVAALLTGAALPERADGAVSQKKLAYSAIILRAEAQGDPSAIDLHANGACRNVLDRSRNSGAQVAKSLGQKLKDPALASYLRQRLVLDVAIWFRR